MLSTAQKHCSQITILLGWAGGGVGAITIAEWPLSAKKLTALWKSYCNTDIPLFPSLGCLCGVIWQQHEAFVRFLLDFSEDYPESGAGGSLHHSWRLSRT